jgi:LemA protein
VKTSWSQVENVYQRRLDLIPNIVASVKWEANFEQETLIWVVNARASATKLNVNVNDAKEMADFQQSQWQLTQALWRFLMVTENYPTLQSNKWVMDLRVSLEWTENRITVERQKYNEVVWNYNIFIRKFPNNIVASLFWFAEKTLFESKSWADVAPVVDFEK